MADKYPTHGFEKAREQRGKGYDGDYVSHVLDYYFPEWHHKNGIQMQLAGGKTDDGRRIITYLNVDRNLIVRLELEEDKTYVMCTLQMDRPKNEITKLWRHGDWYDHDKSDRRFFQLMADHGA